MAEVSCSKCKYMLKKAQATKRTISVQMGREALELVKKFLEQREFTTIESDIYT